jgi:hypothetical protein
MIKALVRIVLTGVLFSLIGVAILIGQILAVVSPITPMSAPITLMNSGQAYYIKSDSEVDAYGCPSIECNVAVVLNPNTTVSVLGSAQGEALVPIAYNKAIPEK